MRTSKFSIDSPEVRKILDGVTKSTGKGYFRIEESGKHTVVAARNELMRLGMGAATATHLLQSSHLPTAPFIYKRKSQARPVAEREPITEIEARLEVYEPAPLETQPADRVVAPPAPSRSGPPPLTEEEREAKAAKAEEKANGKRFQLIATNSGSSESGTESTRGFSHSSTTEMMPSRRWLG